MLTWTLFSWVKCDESKQEVETETRDIELITIQTGCLWGRGKEQPYHKSNNPKLEFFLKTWGEAQLSCFVIKRMNWSFYFSCDAAVQSGQTTVWSCPPLGQTWWSLWESVNKWDPLLLRGAVLCLLSRFCSLSMSCKRTGHVFVGGITFFMYYRVLPN